MTDRIVPHAANRSPGASYQEILDRDTRNVPDILRIEQAPDLGTEPIRADRYYDPAFFDLEARHMWFRTWQIACREEEIPNPGDHVLYEIVDRSLIITRQQDGTIRAFHNSCPHRGRKLATSNGCKAEFRCPYHGLSWQIDGSLKSNPLAWDFPHVDDEEWRLPDVQVGTWGGFVFINFDRDAQPLDTVIAPLPDHFRTWDLEGRYTVFHLCKTIRANWKAVAEAFMESHHSPTTHPQLLPSLADINSQYDQLSEHVTRHITAQMVASPMAPKAYSESDIVNAVLSVGSRFSGDGKTSVTLDDGVTARAYMADIARTTYGEQDGRDYSEVADAEMVDAILHNVFPNLSLWGGFMPNLVYCWRPDGTNVEQALMDIYLLKPVPRGGERPKPASTVYIGADESFSSLVESGAISAGLAGVFDQDMGNLPHVQTGLRASGTGVVQLGLYSEMRIRHLHQMIDRYIAEGQLAETERGHG